MVQLQNILSLPCQKQDVKVPLITVLSVSSKFGFRSHRLTLKSCLVIHEELTWTSMDLHSILSSLKVVASACKLVAKQNASLKLVPTCINLYLRFAGA